MLADRRILELIAELRSGRALCPVRSISAISPAMNVKADDGTETSDGRLSACPNALAKSSMVTGLGAVGLNAPRAFSFAIKKQIKSISFRDMNPRHPLLARS